MDAVTRIERALSTALDRRSARLCPPRLAEAMHYAVFPRGARIRPRLTLAVAHACGDDVPALAEAAAAAIELLHCASLVHDDMPCFDDSNLRRGKPTVHVAFGAPLALLTGDALIVAAFQTLAEAAHAAPLRLASVLQTVADGVGAPMGICAGQAWECEPSADLELYQRAKTGALFAAAAGAGAASAGLDPLPWRGFGEKLGEAYQVADDIGDAVGGREEMGKPIGQDLAHARPSAVSQLGLAGAIGRLEALTGEAVAAIPPCPRAGDLQALIKLEARRLLPKDLALTAA